MEWIIWVIVIVLIIAIVWWLLNRNSSTTAGARGAAGTDQVTSSPSQAGTDRPRAETTGEQTAGAEVGQPGIQAGGAAIAAAAGTAGMAGATRIDEPGRTETHSPGGAAPVRQNSSPAASQPNPEDVEPDIESWDAATPRTAAGTPSGGDVDDWDDDEDKAEWETQWSEAGPGTGPGTRTGTAEPRPAAESASTEPAAPVHHPEYTEPHAPTLPGAESAAADALEAEAETRQRIESSAASEAAASHETEPVGHEAAPAAAPVSETPTGEDFAGQPYGEGSAAAAADGSGPEGYAVKADPGSMTYYEEDSAGYDEASAEVWFLSPAHAEAAGFRAPRRTRR